MANHEKHIKKKDDEAVNRDSESATRDGDTAHGNNRRNEDTKKLISALLRLTAMLIICLYGVLVNIALHERVAQLEEAEATRDALASSAAANLDADGIYRFAASDFTTEKLVAKYQNGTWSGSLARSRSGSHVATIDENGELWLDGHNTYKMVDLSKDVSHWHYRSIYHDAHGTYVTYFAGPSSIGNVASDPEPIITRYYRGEPKENLTLGQATSTIPGRHLTLAHAAILFPRDNSYIVRFTVVEDSSTVDTSSTAGPSSMSSAPIEANAPSATDSSSAAQPSEPPVTMQFEIFPLGDFALSPVKVSPTSVRYITCQDDVWRIMELGETGDPVEICASDEHILSVRALQDYPELGDYDEFWLLRLAYTTGSWDGEATTLRRIIKDAGLQATNSVRTEQGLRPPTMERLVLSHLDLDRIACVHNEYIVLDNIPTYYLHATAPWLVDDLKYRQVQSLSTSGFVEIDSAASSLRFSWSGDEPVPVEPTCRFSYAATAKTLAAFPYRDLSSSAVTLPNDMAYNDADSLHADIANQDARAFTAQPSVDFAEHFEILDAINSDNNLRAVVLGCYDSLDADAADASCTVYLWRRSDRIVPLANHVVTAMFLTEINDAYTVGDTTAPLYSRISLVLYGLNRLGMLDDIFAYDNSVMVSDYGNMPADNYDGALPSDYSDEK